MGDEVKIGQQIESLETKLKEFADKATAEIKNAGSVSVETKNALEKFGNEQKAIADRLLTLEQRQVIPALPAEEKSIGAQLLEHEQCEAYVAGRQKKCEFELKGMPWEKKNTITTRTTDGIIVPAFERPGIVPGAFQRLTVESLLPSTSTTYQIIRYNREKLATNNAAEVSEGAAKPESALTFEPAEINVGKVATWLRVTRELMQDRPAAIAYINVRLGYFVNQRIDSQLLIGNGVSPNIKGIFTAGNYTAHGLTLATLPGATSIDVIGAVADALRVAGWYPNAVLMNPADYGAMARLKDSTGQYILGNPATSFGSPIWGLSVVTSAAMTAGQFLVGAFDIAAMVYNREGLVIDMSEHDRDNFITNQVTIRAERRLALTVEIPSALRGGALVLS